MDTKMFLTLLTFLSLSSGTAAKCPQPTKPHATECNKYLKCVELQSKVVSWVTLKCQEGLIYDKNLLSCAIPGDDWECDLGDESEDRANDDRNIYGVDNLGVLEYQEDPDDEDEFLEVIDEDLSFPESRSDDGSGGGEFPINTTPPASTDSMITTQLQRLSQLMQHIQDKENGVIDDDDVTADDLNSFLATQTIHSSSNFQSDNKTPMPTNGRIHPEILSSILEQQSLLNSEANKLTTLSMDATTQKTPKTRPVAYANQDPFTNIQMKSGQGLDGMASHQIVVNRPEGSVLFNVPPTHDNNNLKNPYLSEDILKTILEISKQMETQNNQKQAPQAAYAPQPFYYGVPIPFVSPQNSVQSFYQQEQHNNFTQSLKPEINTKTRPSNVQIISSQKPNEKSENTLQGYFGYQNPKPQTFNPYQDPQKTYQNPNYYFQNNPYTSYQKYSPYSSYQYPSAQNHYANPLLNQYNFDGAYYENRPFVIESSAPYVDHSHLLQQRPFGKESFDVSYEGDGDDSSSSSSGSFEEVLYDDNEVTSEKPKDELICSFVVQRQANKTDCMRYYVCNAKTQEILKYTCPIFTAFNDITKFCDAQSYSDCKTKKDHQEKSSQGQRIYDEAHKALAAVKKESQKVERIASLVKKESEKFYKRKNQFNDGRPKRPQQSNLFSQQFQYSPFDRQTEYSQQNVIPLQPNRYEEQPDYDSVPSNYAQQYEPQASPYEPPIYASTVRPKPVQTVTKRKQPTRPPPVQRQPVKSQSVSNRKKKKVKCRDAGNIPDPLSPNSYWHCFKGTDGRMKRINRKCTGSFIFCSTTRYCSPASSCN